MPLCLTFFSRGLDEPVLRNHSHYCRLYGYPHQWIEAHHIYHFVQRDFYKYGQILRHLRGLAENDWLLFIDDDSAIFKPVDLDRLMAERDLLVVEGPSANGGPSKPLTNMMVFRNTASNRALVHALMTDSSLKLLQSYKEEDGANLWRALDLLPCNVVIDNTYTHISWRIINWFNAHAFAVSLGPLPSDDDPISYMLHDLNLQAMLVKQINAALIDGAPVLQAAAYPALSNDTTSCHNPGCRIAFVTFYSHHIVSYGRVAEHNLKRYCERHGYTYHVHRQLPAQLESTGMFGSWAKPWLLQRHFSDHEWVIWVDADVLCVNQVQRIEPLLEGRDTLFAKDVGDWPVNSGIMGFRQTAGNAELLNSICEQISQVEDKSGVYSSQGDQYYINQALSAIGCVGEAHVLDNLAFNTPPFLATTASLLVHFMNLGEPYRSAYMAYWDERSKALG